MVLNFNHMIEFFFSKGFGRCERIAYLIGSNQITFHILAKLVCNPRQSPQSPSIYIYFTLVEFSLTATGKALLAWHVIDIVIDLFSSQ